VKPKITIYRSRRVEEALTALRTRFPKLPDVALVRLALGALGDEITHEDKRSSETGRLGREAHRVFWN
jgi:hypothetical protein